MICLSEAAHLPPMLTFLFYYLHLGWTFDTKSYQSFPIKHERVGQLFEQLSLKFFVEAEITWKQH